MTYASRGILALLIQETCCTNLKGITEGDEDILEDTPYRHVAAGPEMHDKRQWVMEAREQVPLALHGSC